MSDERARRLAQLGRAYESGILDEDTYRAAVAALGPDAEVAASLEGGGSIAQKDSVSAGAGGVAVGRDIHGNVYVGAPPQDNAEALRIYRRVLVATSRHLPLRGVDLGASDPTTGQQRFDLDRVYVSLDTTSQVPLSQEEQRQPDPTTPINARETRPLGVLEAALGNRRLAFLGDPGSGKTTFLGHLALCLAIHSLEPEAGWLDHLPCWPDAEAEIVPIPVILRDFGRWLPESGALAQPRHLWDFVVSRLEAQNLAFAAEPLHEALEKGRAIVLLDGLDEIPTRSQRAFVRDAVAAFALRYPKTRIAVTCRTLSYQDPAWQLPGFPAFELAPFNEERIDRFIEAWYAELARLDLVRSEEAGAQARRLREAVRRPDLWQLAPNPLLLTVMALVHAHKGRLPDARALLYEDTIDILLWRWDQIKAGGDEGAPRLRQLLLDAGRTDVDLKRVLWRLAFEAHGQGGAEGPEALADIGELRLQKALAGLHPEGSLDWAQQVIEAMKMRAGLLLERAPEVFTFPHRTFQEYLAGAHLSAQADFARQGARLAAEGALWREVVLLAVGRLVYLGGDTDKPLALVGELCPAKAADQDAAWQKAWLAGEALLEMGLNRVQDSALGQDLVERARHRLADLVQRGRLSAVERAAAGRALARLGDPRPGVGLDPATGLPDIAWCEVPSGRFVMGSRDNSLAFVGKEAPQRKIHVAAFRAATYPLTNAQYAAFLAAGGYGERRYWTDAGWEWKQDRAGPATYGGAFGLANHPVVGVSWYEAVAFCRWLTERLRERGHIGRDEEVRLPTEAEREKAARGPNGRIYPWGDDFGAERCNMSETGIGTTSAVGAFPGGASPYGLLDMSGNVWEWCGTRWRDSYEELADESLEGDALRVLRGGSFSDIQSGVRCAYRSRRSPSNWYSGRGFRVVVAPVDL